MRKLKPNIPRPPTRYKPLWCRWHKRLGRWTASVRVLGQETYVGQYASLVNANIAVNVWLQGWLGGLNAAWMLRKKKKRETGLLGSEVMMEEQQPEEQAATKPPLDIPFVPFTKPAGMTVEGLLERLDRLAKEHNQAKETEQ